MLEFNRTDQRLRVPSAAWRTSTVKHSSSTATIGTKQLTRKWFVKYFAFWILFNFQLISPNSLCAGVSCLREHALGRQRPSQCQLPSASEHAPSVRVRHNSGAWVVLTQVYCLLSLIGFCWTGLWTRRRRHAPSSAEGFSCHFVKPLYCDTNDALSPVPSADCFKLCV